MDGQFHPEFIHYPHCFDHLMGCFPARAWSFKTFELLSFAIAVQARLVGFKLTDRLRQFAHSLGLRAAPDENQAKRDKKNQCEQDHDEQRPFFHNKHPYEYL